MPLFIFHHINHSFSPFYVSSSSCFQFKLNEPTNYFFNPVILNSFSFQNDFQDAFQNGLYPHSLLSCLTLISVNVSPSFPGGYCPMFLLRRIGADDEEAPFGSKFASATVIWFTFKTFFLFFLIRANTIWWKFYCEIQKFLSPELTNKPNKPVELAERIFHLPASNA